MNRFLERRPKRNDKLRSHSRAALYPSRDRVASSVRERLIEREPIRDGKGERVARPKAAVHYAPQLVAAVAVCGILDFRLAKSVESKSLVILECSQRKQRTSRLIPAIERYDGPLFRVFRKHARDPHRDHQPPLPTGDGPGGAGLPTNGESRPGKLSGGRESTALRVNSVLLQYLPPKKFENISIGVMSLERPYGNAA